MINKKGIIFVNCNRIIIISQHEDCIKKFKQINCNENIICTIKVFGYFIILLYLRASL